MRYIILLGIVLLLPAYGVWAQVGEKVSAVKLLTMNKDTVELPMLGEKNLLIFYPDPDHSKQNSNLQDYFKDHPIKSKNIDSYGVINMADAPMIPNSLIRFMVRRETEGTNAQVYLDPNHVLGDAWHLGNVNNKSCVIFVNKDKVIEFFVAGQVTDDQMQEVINLVAKNK